MNILQPSLPLHHHPNDNDLHPSDSVVVAISAPMATHYVCDRDQLVYELIVRQEPKQARMCGVGGKADRRPIDPPPIVQLRVIDPSSAPSHSNSSSSSHQNSQRRRTSSATSPPGSPTPSATSRHHGDTQDTSSPGSDPAGYAQSFLQNPYYFMFASLAKPDDDAELHWLKDGRTRCTTGSVVSSLYHLKDPQHNNEDAGFFVFPDLSVRTEGSYRLKLSLFEVVGNNVRHCKSIYSAPFYVYTAKKFPGMEESTPLSCSLADQGIKIRIRKDIRVRKRPIQALEPLPLPIEDSSNDNDDDEHQRTNKNSGRDNKRSRTDDGIELSGGSNPGLAQQPHIPQQQPWPPVASIDPTLGPTIPPPPPPQVIPPPPPPGQEPGNGVAMGVNMAPGVTLGGPSVYDGRGGGYHPYEPQTPAPQVQSQQQQGPPPAYRDQSHPQQQPQQQQQQHGPPPPQQHQPQQQPQPPYPPQQQQHPQVHHIPPPPQHMHPPHMPHHAPPPPPQGYAPYPQQGWGPPPLPHQSQPVYDPHGYYNTQPQQPHHYAPHPSQYPQHHPPPARYDYAGPMYAQPPPVPPPNQPVYGYYDQHQPQHPIHQPGPPPPGIQQPPPHQQHPSQQPPPHQQPQQPQQPPHMQVSPQYAPAPATTAPGTASPSGSIAPPLSTQHQPHPSTPGYTDYPAYTRAATVSPRPYHPHAHAQPTTPYAPYPPHMPPQHMQHPSQRPNPYAPQPPPPYPYGYSTHPGPEWGTPPGFGSSPTGWGDAYGAQQHHQSQQHQQTQPQAQAPGQQAQSQVTAPPPAPSTSSGLVGAVGSPGDRIQLAPLRASSGNVSSPVLPLSMPVTGSNVVSVGGSHPQQPSNVGYPVIQLRSSSRNGYTSGTRSSIGEREDRVVGGGRDTERGKKNPLSIGSIISDDA